MSTSRPSVRTGLARWRRRNRHDPGLVLVTGAGSGIGRATAHTLAQAGAEVVVTDIDGEAAASTAAAIADAGGDAVARRLDVADTDEWSASVAWLAETRGVPDVLVNNAGLVVAGRFLDLDAGDWDRALSVNLLGVVHGCRIVGAEMVARGHGHIVNVGSMNSFTPAPTLSTYSVGKAGVKMLSECLAQELAPHGVRVTVLMPGMIDTGIVDATTMVTSDTVDTELAEFERGMLAAAFRRGHPPEVVARAVLRSIRSRRVVRPVGPEAWAGWWTSRIAPGLVRRGVDQVLSVDRMRSLHRLAERLPARGGRHEN